MNFKKIWNFVCKAVKEFFCGPRLNKYTVREIAEMMKPVPYESIKDRLPNPFAENVARILKAEAKGK